MGVTILGVCFMSVSLYSNNNELPGKEYFVEVPGGKVWCKLYGEHLVSRETPLVLIHGGPGGTSDYFEPILSLSVDRPILVYNQLGSLKSKDFDATQDKSKLWNKDRFLDELSCVVKSLSVEKVDLLGHSWGGVLALEYAAKFPDKVVHLVLSSPLINSQRWACDAKELIKELGGVDGQVLQDYIEGKAVDEEAYKKASANFFYAFVFPLHVRKRKELFPGFNFEIYEYMWGKEEFSVTGNLKEYNGTMLFEKLITPTFISCGRYDEARPSTLQDYAAKIKNARLVIYENSRHAAHLEETELYLKNLENFLNS